MSTWKNNKFLLSDERKYRILRHVFFWVFWGLYFTMVRELNPKFYKETGHFPDFFKTMAEAFFFLLPQAVLVYPLLYFILPRFVFTGKYIKASFWIVVFLALTLFASATLLIYIPWHKIAWLTSQQALFQGATPITKWMLAYLSALQGGLTAAALAASFKMFKHFYLKNLRNIQLQQENTEAQLQLLTAQVQPHFLFNTLNNIYSQTQNESPKGSRMIMDLSDLLRYILAEGNKSRVPLRKELAMISNYLSLEKVRYGNKLDLHVSLPSTTGDLMIAPLLLLPFVENCFKHGASKFLKSPWVSMNVELDGAVLIMKLMNGKDQHHQKNVIRSGTGITNVRKRLDLMYPSQYQLEIKDEPDVFVVNLKVQLDGTFENVSLETDSPITVAYA